MFLTFGNEMTKKSLIMRAIQNRKYCFNKQFNLRFLRVIGLW